VNDTLNEQGREINYTTTLKLMQIMAEKEILKRDESSMKHIYIPAQEEQKTKGYLLNRFVDTMFNGSASQLMMQLLGNKKPSKKELQELKKLLDKLDKEK
jgi:BlaI family penicillinase repressor